MPVDQRILQAIANPTAGLSQVGEMYAKGTQVNRAQQEQKLEADAHKLAMADMGSKITGAYASSAIQYKKDNPKATDEEFANYQLQQWNSLDPAHREFVPKEFQTLTQLKQGQVRSESIQRALHPENFKEKEKKSSFELVTLIDPEDPDNEKSFHKDDKARVREHIDKGWAVREGAAATTNVILPGDKSYAKERLKLEAVRIDEQTDAAESAYNQIQSLKRFKDASVEGYQGSLQPIMTGARNLVASFGYDSEKLKDVRFMEQALGEIQAQYMRELGARGLTDKDMEILKRAMPRVETDKIARDAIADVLIKASERKIDEWEHNMEEEKRKFPEISEKIRQPYWHSLYKEQRENREVFEKADAILMENKRGD